MVFDQGPNAMANNFMIVSNQDSKNSHTYLHRKWRGHAPCGLKSALDRAPAAEVLPRTMAAARSSTGSHSHARETSRGLLFVPSSGCGSCDPARQAYIDGRNLGMNSLHRQ